MGMSRSENMRRITSKNTTPELAVRQALRALGFTGYRLHRKDLPGKPDIVFIGRQKAILIHGCFWHGHSCKIGSREPKSNRGYWLPKIERNRQRDQLNQVELARLGWATLTLWECEIKNPDSLQHRLAEFMAQNPPCPQPDRP